MADGKVEIEIELENKKAKSQASKAGKEIGDAVKSGAKTADSALDGLKSKFGSAFTSAGKTAKDSMRGVGDSAEDMGERVDKATEKGSGGFSSLAKKAVGALAAIGAVTKAAEFLKSSLDAFATYQQLEGGVQTLFGAGGAESVEDYAKSVGKSVEEAKGKYEELKTAESMVFENAKVAYKEAGVSMNTYMEQATSFSASLVSSLGGDTVKAAEYANIAIVDMSDNANKMGTSIDMIQNAYQGFAKQNYTMLDNLKLGYGGTKTEMERLIADANKLKEAQGEAANLTIDSYADVIEAIHLVQNEMGITGTTQKEATETIEGSINMAKAAYENFLVGLADDNANIEELTQQLFDSIGTAAENIIPRLTIIVTTLVRTLVNILPQVASSLISSASEMVVELAAAIISAAPSLVQAAIQIMGQFTLAILQAIPSLITQIVETLPESIPMLIEAALDVVTEIVETLPEIVQALVDAMPDIIKMLVTTIVDSIDVFIQGFIALFLAVVDALPQIISALVSAIPTVIQALVDALLENIETLVNGFVQLFMAFVLATPQIIEAIIPMIPQIIEAILSAILQNIPQLLSAAVQLFLGFIQGIAQSIPTIVSKVGEIGIKIISKIGEIPGKMLDIGRNIVEGLWNGIGGAVDWLIGKIQGFCSDALGAIKGFFGIQSPSKLMRDVVGVNLAKGMVIGFEKEDPAGQMMKLLEDGFSDLELKAKGVSLNAGSVTGEGLVQGFDRANPMSQIADTVRSSFDSLAVMLQSANTSNYTTNSQTVNFNQPISSPDQIARTMRMQQRYGLAGSYS